MVFSYKVPVTGSWIPFYSDEDASAQSFDGSVGSGAMPIYAPETSGEATHANLALSSLAFRYPRGNVKAMLGLKWNCQYSSADAAVDAFRVVRLALVNQMLHLKVKQGVTVHYYPNALCSPGHYSCNVTGQSADHSIQFEADDVTLTAPT